MTSAFSEELRRISGKRLSKMTVCDKGGAIPNVIRFTVRETNAPDGYVLDTMPKSVVIKEDEAQILTFYDSPSGRDGRAFPPGATGSQNGG